ncbi:MAG: phosphoglycerate kinase, partial [Spirochaetales bacterium]|nr:phosphoglycerate kinase [Spirochaetales bacterium]
RNAIGSLRDGEVLLLDNVRFMAEEQTLFETKLCLSHEDQAKTQVVTKLAPLGDLYVCDAFAAAHRDQPTLCGFEQILPSAMGRLFEKEYCTVSSLMEEPERPCVFVLGGAKIADAFQMMKTVLSKGSADLVLTGGLVANIFLASQNVRIGKGSLDFIMKSNYGQFIDVAKELYGLYADRIVLPVDLAWVCDGKRHEAGIGEIPEEIAAVDIGSGTAERYRKEILNARTVFVNGPAGVFEQEASELGTKTIWQALADTKAFTVLGGGDSITATEKYDLTDRIGYICTGGGALIRFLSGEELPVVKALRHGATIGEK